MNIEDLIFVQTCEIAPEQYDVIDSTTVTKVGYIRERHNIIECHPYDPDTQEIKWKHDLIDTAKEAIDDDILMACGDAICDYQNKLAFLKIFQ